MRNNNTQRQHTLKRRQAIAAGMRAVWARRKAEGYQPSMAGVIAMHAAKGRVLDVPDDVEAQLQRLEAAARARRWRAA